METLGANITGLVIQSLLGLLAGALTLQFTVKNILKFKPAYKSALKITFLVYLALIITGVIAGLAVYFSANTADMPFNEETMGMLPLISLVSTFLVQTGVYKQVLKHPETGAISVGKASLISLIQLILLGFIFSIAGVILYALE